MNQKKLDGFRVGVDIGGTFTDIVLLGPDGEAHTKKVLSTPENYGRAVVEGLRQVCAENAVDISAIQEVVHGSTIVTNAIIELTGAKVGLITTKGFRDVLEIGRGRMPVIYDLSWVKPVPLVPRDLRFEVDERINSQGDIVRPLDMKEVNAVIDRLLACNIESIAVCLINSPTNPIHERRIGEILSKRAPHLFVSLSTEVMPMIMEYERTSETALNAYVMPVVSSYMKRLRGDLKDAGCRAPVYIMQSSGGMVSPESSVQRPIEIIECGPAAGVVGAAHVADRQGIKNLITFDMGGTTAKASIVENGAFTRSAEYEVGGRIHKPSRLLKGGGYIVRVPSIDIAEVGTGGGSIVHSDIGGALHIGPRSAGADPGPACYGRGGSEPTLTDADLILGYINPNHLCGGEFPLDPDRAQEAIEQTVARTLGKNAFEAAFDVHILANAYMMRAIRAVSSERGRDPRKFWLYAFGGAGPVHAAGVAAGLGIDTVVLPPAPGVFSAHGLLCAEIERHYARHLSLPWSAAVLDDVNRVFDEMIAEAAASAAVWGGGRSRKPKTERLLDLQYEGQGSCLSIRAPTGKLTVKKLDAIARAFEDEHRKTYGHVLSGLGIRLMALRLTARLSSSRPSPTVVTKTISSPAKARASTMTRAAYWGPAQGSIETPVMSFDALGFEPIAGPVLIDCYDTTIVVPPNATIVAGEWGNAVLTVAGKEGKGG